MELAGDKVFGKNTQINFETITAFLCVFFLTKTYLENPEFKLQKKNGKGSA